MDSIIRRKVNVIRRVNVRYHNASESETVSRTTDRCVRSLVCLYNIVDGYWIPDRGKVEARAVSEMSTEPMVQLLRVIRDNSSNCSLLSDSGLNNTMMPAGKCRCCCARMSHDLEPRVCSVNIAKIVRSQEMIADVPTFPYVKEYTIPEDRFIVSENECEDEMFEMSNAVKSDLKLIPDSESRYVVSML